MNLPELVLWSMGALLSPSSDRLHPVAHAVAIASEEAPIFEGDAGDAATALMLTSIARHESGLLESVRRCKRRGDQDRSIGLYQTMRGFAWGGFSEEEICGSDLLQVTLARNVLAYHRSRCAGCGPSYLLQAYASGDGGKESDAAANTLAVFERVAKKAGIKVRGSRATWIGGQ